MIVTTPDSSDLHALLCAEAAVEGFEVSGGVDIAAAFQDPEQRFAQHVAKYDEWITKGSAGEMAYLVRGRDRRADPRLVFPAAKSVFSVAISYPRTPAGARSPLEGPRYARYLQGPDYHEDIKARLERVMARVFQRWKNDSEAKLEWKICVDHSAVLERTWAYLAGLGWIGKNTMLIHPKLGSYLFLGEVLLSETLGREPRPMKDYCGNCTRCLQGCPTQAIEPGRFVESRKCISYQTLEKRGPFLPKDSASRAFGEWVAGCDVCQEVCPFNLKSSRADESRENPPAGDNATTTRTWIELLEEDEASYLERIRGSALDRVKHENFRRNLVWALRNSVGALDAQSRRRLDPRIIPLVEARISQETSQSISDTWRECLALLLR